MLTCRWMHKGNKARKIEEEQRRNNVMQKIPNVWSDTTENPKSREISEKNGFDNSAFKFDERCEQR